MTARLSRQRRAVAAADIYNDLDVHAAIPRIAWEFDISHRSAERLIKLAREMGLITRDVRRRQKWPVAHGTWHGYQSYGCRCEPCKAANAAKARAYYWRKADA